VLPKNRRHRRGRRPESGERGTAEVVADSNPDDDDHAVRRPRRRGLFSLAAKKVFRVVSAALFDRSLEKGGEQLAKWMERSRTTS
jgi:hypothetical protein